MIKIKDMNNENTVLLLPDGRIAQNKKEVCQMLGIGDSRYKAKMRSGEIKRINSTLTKSYEITEKQ